jgi:hypothetical protein
LKPGGNVPRLHQAGRKTKTPAGRTGGKVETAPEMRKTKIIRQEMEAEISLHYNAASKEKRKEFDEDVFYKLHLKGEDYEAALGRANEIFFGSARHIRDMRRQMKMKRKLEEEK